jgi:hypothetical protein
MCSLSHTSGIEKRLAYVNPNLINQLELNSQINENNKKYEAMNKTKQPSAQIHLTNEKITIASTYLG